MILIFGSFILGGQRLIKEFGLGLAGAALTSCGQREGRGCEGDRAGHGVYGGQARGVDEQPADS